MEDWEDSDFVIPIIKSKEQLKKLEERKLMEESNNKLIEDLFSEEQIKLPDVKQQHIQPRKPPEPESKKNEMKQKEVSRKIKQVKEKMKKDIDGDNNYEYNDYEDKFYND